MVIPSRFLTVGASVKVSGKPYLRSPARPKSSSAWPRGVGSIRLPLRTLLPQALMIKHLIDSVPREHGAGDNQIGFAVAIENLPQTLRISAARREAAHRATERRAGTIALRLVRNIVDIRRRGEL
jgi:hypothetical protein